MSFNITATPNFLRQVKKLSKRYRSMKQDLEEFIDSIKEEPLQGVELYPGIRKIRLAITSKGRGKSGGARVITYTIIAAKNEGEIYLIDIYDKADYSTVDIATIKEVIAAITDLPD